MKLYFPSFEKSVVLAHDAVMEEEKEAFTEHAGYVNSNFSPAAASAGTFINVKIASMWVSV